MRSTFILKLFLHSVQAWVFSLLLGSLCVLCLLWPSPLASSPALMASWSCSSPAFSIVLLLTAFSLYDLLLVGFLVGRQDTLVLKTVPTSHASV